MLILTAPSGAGKTTLCRAILRHDPQVRYSVSATTRPRHAKETPGKDYMFLSDEEFSKLVESGGLLEWEEVYGYRYGTPRKPLEKLLREGFDVVLDLDVKGALAVKKLRPESVTVFLLPPTFAELERRLTSRARDDHRTIKTRLAQAELEIKKAKEFDYVVINDSLAHSVHLLLAILEAERARSTRVEKIELKEE